MKYFLNQYVQRANPFLDLGQQPLANGFLPRQVDAILSEKKFPLQASFDLLSNLVSLKYLVESDSMFNAEYPYFTGGSKTMREHFSGTANRFNAEFQPKMTLEIGSNDGTFIKAFSPETAVCVEPCSNFAALTRDMGYSTYDGFWGYNTSAEIHEAHGLMDLVYSANCMCHIHNLNEAFRSVANVLSKEGVFVFEDPSLLATLKNNSYDQFYDEHASLFSITALYGLLKKVGLSIFRVESTTTHGGSNRVYCSRARKPEKSVQLAWDIERFSGLDNIETYQAFATRVETSKKQLVQLLTRIKQDGKRIVGYGATSKLTVVLNYCGIDSNLLDYVIDTTPAKQGKLMPGTHVEIVSREDADFDKVDFALLGAWNYQDEISTKERKWTNNGGRFITHVPFVRIV